MLSSNRLKTRVVISLILLIITPAAALALEAAPPPDTAPTISVLTFGPGQSAFVAFGHNAFRIQDPVEEIDWVYNFGTFRFNSPWLIVDFLKSRFKYWLGVKPYQRMIPIYIRTNRFVHEQVLDLPPAAARRLQATLNENALPENRIYLYNYYRDNCSTRVRDAIDQLLDGQLKAQFDVPGRMTLREHSLRATAEIWPIYLGIDLVLGDYIDQPETYWQEMFLPEILEEGLGKAQVKGPDGKTRPLVRETRVIHPGKGGPRMRREPPRRTFELLLFGLVFGALMSGLAVEAFRREKRWARILFGLCYGLFGLLAGLLGFILIGLWGFTDHDTAYRNENLYQCAPWAILFLGGAWGILRDRPRLKRFAFTLALTTFAASALGLVLKALPFMDQDNQRIIAFFLPCWTALFAGTMLMRRSEAPPPSEEPPVEVVRKRSKPKKKR